MNQEMHPTQEQLMDYVHGELPDRDDATVHAHLGECSSCAEAHDAEVRLGELLREHARAEERELPPGLVERIYASVREQPSPGWWEGLSALLRPAVAVPAAAVLIAGVGFGFFATHGTARANAIDAAYYLESHSELAATVPFDEGSIAPAMLTTDDAAADERTADATR